LCDRAGVLLIFDEIQTGMGRTGKLFAYEHEGVAPDIMTLAKALANGLPIGAMLSRESVAQAFAPGSHASTFGGTPLVTAAALEVLKILTAEGFMEACTTMGAYLKGRLMELKAQHACIREVRGRGLLLGMVLEGKGGPLVKACLKRGFLINCVQENILRFVPPLTISREQVDALVGCLDALFREGLGVP
jgi:acetylornithine aminotransferase